MSPLCFYLPVPSGIPLSLLDRPPPRRPGDGAGRGGHLLSGGDLGGPPHPHRAGPHGRLCRDGHVVRAAAGPLSIRRHALSQNEIRRALLQVSGGGGILV